MAGVDMNLVFLLGRQVVMEIGQIKVDDVVVQVFVVA